MLYHKILENSVLKLRSLEPEDIEELYCWENNTDNWFVSNTQTPFSRDTLRAYIESSHQDIYTIKQLRLMIVVKETEKTVGAIDLFDFDPNHRRAGVGILISPEHRGKGLAKNALDTITKYCFEVLNTHQLFCNIPANNTPSHKLFKSCGFTEIGRKKEWLRTPQGWIDEIMYQKINTTNIL